jgi:hypothetical protein
VKPRTLEHPFGRVVADAHVRLDAVHAARERVRDHRLHRSRGDAASAGRHEQPVAELDHVAHRVEVVERSAAEQLAGLRVLDQVRRHEAARHGSPRAGSR